jgi:hypothetical protein
LLGSGGSGDLRDYPLAWVDQSHINHFDRFDSIEEAIDRGQPEAKAHAHWGGVVVCLGLVVVVLDDVASASPSVVASCLNLNLEAQRRPRLFIYLADASDFF